MCSARFRSLFTVVREGGPNRIHYVSQRLLKLLISNAHFFMVLRGFAENHRLFKRSVFIYELHKFTVYVILRQCFFFLRLFKFYIDFWIAACCFIFGLLTNPSAVCNVIVLIRVTCARAFFSTGSKLNFKRHLLQAIRTEFQATDMLILFPSKVHCLRIFKSRILLSIHFFKIQPKILYSTGC